MTTQLLKFPRILILLLLISFASISAVLFTPSLPGLAHDFGISEERAQLTMTLFLIGYALGQLPYGPIANRFGRKKAIYIGVVLAIIGTFLAYSASAFWVLCLGRFIQAIGSAVGLKIVFTMISDQHAGPSATKAFSIVMLAFGIMPGIGVAVGGFITVLWGWSGCFIFLALYSLLLGLLSISLPETAKSIDKNALQLKKIYHGYARQFKDPFMTSHAILSGLTSALLYLFASISPYVGIETIGLTPDYFGLWSIIPSTGLFFGIILTRRLAGRQTPRMAILSGILLALLGTLTITIAFANDWVNPWTLFWPMFLVQVGDALIYTNAATNGVSDSHDKSNASAVMQFITMSIATIAMFLASLFPPTTILLIPASFGLVVILMLCIWLKLRAHRA